MSQTSLNRRVRKARHAVKAGVLQKVDRGYRIPSRTQPDHHVVLARFFRTTDEAGYSFTCHYEHHAGQWRCPGNQFGHVCWHVIAAMLASSKRSVAFFEELGKAKRYQNLGGRLCVVQSRDGSGRLYAVIGRKHVKKNSS